MNSYDIWVEGYSITGGGGTAQRICSYTGNNFKDACKRANDAGKFSGYGNYDSQGNSLWGCRLFDNEMDARRSFG